MKHVIEITALVKTLIQSTRFHALVIRSKPGFAKSSTIDEVLKQLGVPAIQIGCYSTSLSLYNSICNHPSEILILDDNAAVFNDPIAMAILKAATWPSSGSPDKNGQRVVTWASTGVRAVSPSTVFNGKLILLTNHVPTGRSAESFLSRALYLSQSFTADEVTEMLLAAGKDLRFYENTDLSSEVAGYLAEALKKRPPGMISLRTLQMGYELAKANPSDWQTLLNRLLPSESPAEIVAALDGTESSLNSQIETFIHTTGLSRRTFFNYRKRISAGDVHLKSVEVQSPLKNILPNSSMQGRTNE